MKMKKESELLDEISWLSGIIEHNNYKIEDLKFKYSLCKNILDGQLKISDRIFAENKNLNDIIDKLLKFIENSNIDEKLKKDFRL